VSNIQLGVIVPLEKGARDALSHARDLDFPTCQVVCWDPDLLTAENAAALRDASKELDVRITAFWAGLPGRYVWDFVDGPRTIGLVPRAMRDERLAVLLDSCDFARDAGVDCVVTHVGFIPEDPQDPLYAELLAALAAVVERCRANDQTFCFETGQETPVTLLRTIQDLGCEHVGVNLDPANLLLYGKANPVDALDVFGPFVRGVHAKDGEYPTDGTHLGEEKPIGDGRVDFPALVAKLKELGYRGALTIEREISGDRQIRDIRAAKSFFASLIDD